MLKQLCVLLHVLLAFAMYGMHPAQWIILFLRKSRLFAAKEVVVH